MARNNPFALTLEIQAELLQRWAQEHSICCDFIQSCKPAQNALIERYNGTSREEVLDQHNFRSPQQA